MRMARGTCAVIVLGSLLGGCAKYTQPVPRVRELSAAEKNFESLWDASLQTLRKYGFTLAEQDRRAGIIKTAPTISQHFTEFWRREASTSRDVLEGSLHTVYRTVTIEIAPTEPGGEKFKAVVQVYVTRSNRREPHITSASQAYELFSNTARERLQVEYGEDGGAGAEDKDKDIVPLGRDGNLEARLSTDISVASGSPVAGK